MEPALEIIERHVGDVAVLALKGQMLLHDGDLAFGKRVSELTSRGILKIL